ncbi:MAG TPA: LPS export ABC transporter periplasmic protein LptC [Candidatus Elarobacter sp.]|jgi:LPS export ABC transporter protein LptC|nr:LPS export ABC transporter periplasmic protein LptC [Candidatus Elarobacter sp.]
MRSTRRSSRWARPLLAPALLLALAPAGCGGRAAHPARTASSAGPAATATPVPIRVETRGDQGEYVRIVETVRGRKVYTILALSDEMVRGGTNDTVGHLEQPHITFIDRNGVTTIADAPKAQISERDKSVTMTGGVHAHTSSGSVLSCDVLVYRSSTERFHGEGHVQLTAPNGLVMDGRSLDGDVRLQDVNVTGSPE